MSNRIIAIFTGNRAEYGLQLPIIRAIDLHPQLTYRLIASGAHLDPDFGQTRAEIEGDKIKIYDEAEILMDESVPYATPQAISSVIVSVAKILSNLKPDFFVVYADRFEGFAALIAATQMNIPTAHIEGGDVTEGGALDDSVRHSMTKLAHLHFTTNEEASRRIISMGEEPWRVKTVGFPAIDLIKAGEYASPGQIKNLFSSDLRKTVIVFTQHSVTTEHTEAAEQIRPSIAELSRRAMDGNQVIISYPNNDAGGRDIISILENFMSDAPVGLQLHRSMGRYYYHGLLALALTDTKVVCAGNSSSGIKETPAFGCPTVNIGSRQEKRLRADNILDVNYDENEIYAAINSGINDKAFCIKSKSSKNPYGMGNAGKKIAEVLANIPINKDLIRKRMTIDGS